MRAEYIQTKGRATSGENEEGVDGDKNEESMDGDEGFPSGALAI